MKRLIAIAILLLLLVESQSGFVGRGSSDAAPLCPTNTPCPTDTPIPSTDTPCPTDTPIPPTDTPPPPTDTPVPPTQTPPPTSTPTPEPTETHCPDPTPTPIPTPTPRPKKTPIPPTSTPVTLLPETGGPIQEGRVSQYAEGVFRHVVKLRQGWGQLPDNVSAYDGFIAVRECADIGKAYYIRPIGAEEWDHVLAADCASKSDRQSDVDSRSGYEWMITTGTIAEINYGLAVEWNTVGRMIRVEMMPYLPEEVISDGD